VGGKKGKRRKRKMKKKMRKEKKRGERGEGRKKGKDDKGGQLYNSKDSDNNDSSSPHIEDPPIRIHSSHM